MNTFRNQQSKKKTHYDVVPIIICYVVAMADENVMNTLSSNLYSRNTSTWTYKHERRTAGELLQ